MSHDIMTTKEAAKYLRITRQTLMKLVSKNQISSNKMGRNYRFLKSELDNFIKNNNTDFTDFEISYYHDVLRSPFVKLIPLDLHHKKIIPNYDYASYLCPYYNKEHSLNNRLCKNDQISCKSFRGIFNDHILCDSDLPKLVITKKNNKISIDTQPIE